MSERAKEIDKIRDKEFGLVLKRLSQSNTTASVKPHDLSRRLPLAIVRRHIRGNLALG